MANGSDIGDLMRRRWLLRDVRHTADLIVALELLPETKQEHARRRIAARLRVQAEGLETEGLKRFAARARDMARRFADPPPPAAALALEPPGRRVSTYAFSHDTPGRRTFDRDS